MGRDAIVKIRGKVLAPKKHLRDRDKWIDCEVEKKVPGLTAGEMASLEWKLAVRDKHNRIIILIIPITFDTTRRLSMGFDIMVQCAPANFEALSDLQVFSLLRGFVPAWATPDPAVLAQAQMLDTLNQIGASSKPQPGSGQKSEPKHEEVKPNETCDDVMLDGYVETEKTAPKKETVCLTLVFYGDGCKLTWKDRTVPKGMFSREGQLFEITRQGKSIGVVAVKCVSDTTVEFTLIDGCLPESGDSIRPVKQA